MTVVTDYGDLERRVLAQLLNEAGPDIGVDMEGPVEEVTRLLDLANIAPRFLPRFGTARLQHRLAQINAEIADLLQDQYPTVEVVYVEESFLWARKVRLKALTTK